MLEADEYKIMHDWGSEEGAQYPSLMVFVSPTMMANYQKYGDVVSFSIIPSLLKNSSAEIRRFRVGVFCVYDTNMRMLLAGIAIMCQETIVEMYRIFQLFIRIHSRLP